MPGKHALLSASSAARWMACPPSVREEAKVPDKPSVFAAEGTLAHAWGEYFLRQKYLPGTGVEPKEEMDGEMAEAVRFYVDAVSEAFETEKPRETIPSSAWSSVLISLPGCRMASVPSMQSLYRTGPLKSWT